MNRADSRIYPAKEMKAIDMAELMRTALIEDGIIQGCRFNLDGGHLMMDPGRIVIGGRLGVFEAPENQTQIDIALPSASSLTSDAQRYICAVYDPGDTNPEKMYIELLSQTEINNRQAAGSRYDPTRTGYDTNFNVNEYAKIIKLGFVKVRASSGEAYDLDVSTTTYPYYAIKSNATYVDGEIDRFKTRENNRYDYLKAVDTYVTSVRHRSAWFKNHTVTVDGVTVAAGKTTTIRIRKEYGGVVFIKPDSGSAPSFPNDKPYTYINKDGGTPISSSPGPNPRVQKQVRKFFEGTTAEVEVITNTNEVDLNRGIVGVHITNASSGGTGGTNCVVQSYWVDEPASSGNIPAGINWQGFMNVIVRNVGSTAAKIKLEITSLYVRNADFNY